MERLLPKLGMVLVLMAASMGGSLAQSANMSRLADIKANQDSGIQLVGCVKICGRYGKCWRNGHWVRCCTRWICRY
jgi:hypothetical protein